MRSVQQVGNLNMASQMVTIGQEHQGDEFHRYKMPKMQIRVIPFISIMSICIPIQMGECLAYVA